MQSRPSFRPMPTPTTPGSRISRSSCFRLTVLTALIVAIVRSFNASAAYISREPGILNSLRARAVAAISRRRRTNESFLHEGLRLLAGPANHLEGSLVQRVAGLRDSGDPLLHRFEGHRG